MEILARAVGRRKEAVAQVQIVRGTGQFLINDKSAKEYLHDNLCSLKAIKAPFSALEKTEININPAAKQPAASLPGAPYPYEGFTSPPSRTSPPSGMMEMKGERGENVLKGYTLPSSGRRDLALLPNSSILNLETLDTRVKVKGGGLIGQAEAIKLGIARALCDLESLSIDSNTIDDSAKLTQNQTLNGAQSLPFLVSLPLVTPPHRGGTVGRENNIENNNQNEIRKQLKTKGFLTQDSRVKERRKYGLKKARKASQYHKR